MDPREPLVSVGMPVFNGGRYLQEAIDSVLQQEVSDLELVISDNGSTDGTQNVCQQAQLADPRVRYARVETNRGAAWNYNNVLELARGQFFHWAAADDRFAPSYLDQCVQALAADSGAVLAYTSASIIDGDNRVVEAWSHRAGYAAQGSASQRFRDVLWNSGKCFEIFGLMRRDQLARTQRIQPFVDSDRSLLTTLAMMGRFTHIDAPLYINRDHDDDSMHRHPERRDRAQWFDPSASTRFPQWRLMRAFASSAWSSSASPREGLEALGALLTWMYGRRRNILVYEVLRSLPKPVRVLVDRGRQSRGRRGASYQQR